MSTTATTQRTPLLQETIADIAYLAGAKRYHSGDSREDVQLFIVWAQEFEATKQTVTPGTLLYNGKEYLEAIEAFTLRKLEASGHCRHKPCPVCSANVHGRVTVALGYLDTGKIAKGKAELRDLLPLVAP